MAVQPIELAAGDGLVLRGERWGESDDWVLLLHDAGKDLDALRPLCAPLARRGFTVLSFDLRGHGGSDDPWDSRHAHLDAEAAAAFARAEGAVTRFAVGAGIGAIALLQAAERDPLDALVLLSPGPAEGVRALELRGRGASRLFFVGSLDGACAQVAEEFRRASTGWSLLVSFPTAEQGSDLLESRWARHLREHAVAFLAEQRHLARNRRRRVPSRPPHEPIRRRLLGF